MSHYFLAIKLPKSLQAYYHQWQLELKEIFPYKRWTHKEDLHITLFFLGHVADDTKEEMIRRLTSVQQSSFDLSFSGLSSFGKSTSPRVLYVDVLLNGSLSLLQRKVVNITEEFGFKKEERKFTPHLTLAKRWAIDESIPLDKMKEVQARYAIERRMNVSEFQLYKIHPGKNPSYECVAVFPLSK